MTGRLALATLAFGEPMGQQVYEQELARRAPAILGDQWHVDRVVARTMRSPLAGTVRLPSRLLADSPPWLRRQVGRAVYRGYDLVHRFDLRLPPAPYPEVLTIHDVVAWRFVDEARPPTDAAATARRAAAVVCPSEFSAGEVSAQLGVTTAVAIPNGVDAGFFDASALGTGALADLGIRQPFVLHAGGCSDRKNLAGLAGAWPLVRDARPGTMLVLMGPADPRRDRLFGPLPDTRRLGRVDDRTARRDGGGIGHRGPVALRGLRPPRPRGDGPRCPGGRGSAQLPAGGVR